MLNVNAMGTSGGSGSGVGVGTGAGVGIRIGVGSVIGPCRLGAPLGAGGMGVVYEAELAGGDRVAVKLLRREWLSDRFMVGRFRVEAIAGRLVHHPNVASVLERGETEDGLPFLVMERVHGEPLGVRIERDGPLSPRRAAVIVSQILDGLDAIHRAGVVHGDVKSDNVLVETRAGGADAAKLIDFGLAQVRLAPQPERPDSGVVAGTPEYMAPELVCGRAASDASDVYAVGVILYELLTGSTPFGGGNPAQVLQRHVQEQPVPPSSRSPAWMIPRHLEQIVMRALEKDRRDRFPTALAFSLALARAMPSLDLCVRRAPRVDEPVSREASTLRWRRGGQPRTMPQRRRLAAGTPGYDVGGLQGTGRRRGTGRLSGRPPRASDDPIRLVRAPRMRP